MRNKKLLSSKKNTFSVTIPTCYGGKSLGMAVGSIRESSGVDRFPIIVRADSEPITVGIKRTLRSLRAMVVENKAPGSQMHKIKQMLMDCHTDIFITTQDDIRFSRDVLSRIIYAFDSDPRLTMVCVSVIPEKQKSLTERIVRIGPILAQAIGGRHNSGDNYLVANGRCLAFRTEFLKKFRLPETIVNNDGYLYFENKRLGGVFKFIPEAHVYIQSPKSIREHLNQSIRFQYSKNELAPWFEKNIVNEYEIGLYAIGVGVLDVFIKDPIAFLLYGVVHVYTRLNRFIKKANLTVFWNVDYSTKRI
jgi:hypothetical protein